MTLEDTNLTPLPPVGTRVRLRPGTSYFVLEAEGSEAVITSIRKDRPWKGEATLDPPVADPWGGKVYTQYIESSVIDILHNSKTHGQPL